MTAHRGEKSKVVIVNSSDVDAKMVVITQIQFLFRDMDSNEKNDLFISTDVDETIKIPPRKMVTIDEISLKIEQPGCVDIKTELLVDYDETNDKDLEISLHIAKTLCDIEEEMEEEIEEEMEEEEEEEEEKEEESEKKDKEKVKEKEIYNNNKSNNNKNNNSNNGRKREKRKGKINRKKGGKKNGNRKRKNKNKRNNNNNNNNNNINNNN